MSELIVVGIISVVSLVIAWVLSVRYHSQSRAIESAVRIPFNLAWFLAGFFTALGGYHKTGAALMAISGYFFLSNSRRVREGEIKASPSNWRRKAANWKPYNRSG